MDFFEKIKSVLFHPTDFFNQLPKEKGLGQAFTFLALFGVVYALLSSLISMFSVSLVSILLSQTMNLPFQESMGTPSLIFGMTGILGFVVQFVVSYIGLIVFSFVLVGILYLWLLLWGGKADYTETYKLWVYASTPQLLLGWIPLVGFLAWIYKVVLLVIGTEIVHKLSRTRAVLAYVVPMVLLFILGIILVIVFIGLFGGALMSGL
ncbi:YIP1 family protein [Candidatus Woesearchaeota archaeon]|nr:YIP1 family protein [Candidatus Woesearchaeota archaeon]